MSEAHHQLLDSCARQEVDDKEHDGRMELGSNDQEKETKERRTTEAQKKTEEELMRRLREEEMM